MYVLLVEKSIMTLNEAFQKNTTGKRIDEVMYFTIKQKQNYWVI